MSLRSFALALALAVLAACGGGGADVKSDTLGVSQQQQLADLRKALDAGAISQTEYSKMREQVLNRRD